MIKSHNITSERNKITNPHRAQRAPPRAVHVSMAPPVLADGRHHNRVEANRCNFQANVHHLRPTPPPSPTMRPQRRHPRLALQDTEISVREQGSERAQHHSDAGRPRRCELLHGSVGGWRILSGRRGAPKGSMSHTQVAQPRPTRRWPHNCPCLLQTPTTLPRASRSPPPLHTSRTGTNRRHTLS